MKLVGGCVKVLLERFNSICMAKEYLLFIYYIHSTCELHIYRNTLKYLIQLNTYVGVVEWK